MIMSPIQMTATMVAAAASSEEGSHNLLLPDTADLVWGSFCFVVIAVLFYKFVLPRFNAILDERTAKIQAGLDLAEKVKAEQSGAEAKVRQEIESAELEAARIRETAHSEAAAIVAQARNEAQAEAGRERAAAQRQIEAEKQAAQISLRSDVGMLAASLAERIVGEQLQDAELSGRVIDRFMDELEAENAAATAAEETR